MVPFDTYVCYLSLKRHFINDNYDYFRYHGKSKSSIQTFYKRKDRFYFEKLSRQKSDSEILNFFVANFAHCNDPERLWIGEIIKNGEGIYVNWQKRIQALRYHFTQEIKNLLESHSFDSLFDCTKGHPILLREHLSGRLSLETMVILNKILSYTSQFNKKLQDPVWSSISRRIQKYSAFIDIDVVQYKSVLKNLVLEKI